MRDFTDSDWMGYAGAGPFLLDNFPRPPQIAELSCAGRTYDLLVSKFNNNDVAVALYGEESECWQRVFAGPEAGAQAVLFAQTIENGVQFGLLLYGRSIEGLGFQRVL